ncbi:CHAP domain-containing protein [Candidatus Saccharibacteria bacterium]|nr:CHAP domain-containing protein [Candidatus Saccharibacteria bacterium]
MVMLKNKKTILKTIFAYTFIFTLIVLASICVSSSSAYNCKAGDTECENAKANMQQNRAEANEYTKMANSVGDQIAALNSEISALNAEIAANEAKVNELNVEIEKNEKKLADNQAALAEMLINMHFNTDSEPITILAGSKSISDYAEKQAREDVAKQEIALASQKIKELKENLNTQKEEVEQAIESSQSKRSLVASKKADQQLLKAQYDKNADDASVLASYWEEQLKLLAWTPPSNTTGNGSRWYGMGNTYPYQGNCPRDNVRYSAYGGAVCQCTSYASWKAKEKWGITNTWGGNASNYVNAKGYYVPATGINTYVDRNPAPYTIAVQFGGAYGHVMWVESVNENGSVNITEYNVNWPSIGCYIGDFCSRKNVGSSNMWFVHFD